MSGPETSQMISEGYTAGVADEKSGTAPKQ